MDSEKSVYVSKNRLALNYLYKEKRVQFVKLFGIS
jgi:hypothetical protein